MEGVAGKRLAAAFPALAELPAHVRDRAIASAQLRRVIRGEVLFAKGDPCPALPFLLSGAVSVQRATADGKTIQTTLPNGQPDTLSR